MSEHLWRVEIELKEIWLIIGTIVLMIYIYYNQIGKLSNVLLIEQWFYVVE